jgi:hypothetical protein
MPYSVVWYADINVSEKAQCLYLEDGITASISIKSQNTAFFMGYEIKS